MTRDMRIVLCPKAIVHIADNQRVDSFQALRQSERKAGSVKISGDE